ncbi:hypothetical protein, partial [Megasphaera massiliensis]|uniref:hypothetical protein n=1 Tax=Megasphaera massiliensis TaxID=1232428 RepID=UPI0034A2D59B
YFGSMDIRREDGKEYRIVRNEKEYTKASAMCPYLLFVLPITYGRYILSAFNFTFFWSHHVKERCFNYKTIIKTEWRITDSNR